MNLEDCKTDRDALRWAVTNPDRAEFDLSDSEDAYLRDKVTGYVRYLDQFMLYGLWEFCEVLGIGVLDA